MAATERCYPSCPCVLCPQHLTSALSRACPEHAPDQTQTSHISPRGRAVLTTHVWLSPLIPRKKVMSGASITVHRKESSTLMRGLLLTETMRLALHDGQDRARLPGTEINTRSVTTEQFVSSAEETKGADVELTGSPSPISAASSPILFKAHMSALAPAPGPTPARVS
eukprot:2364751-Rhodomonas_salina.1